MDIINERYEIAINRVKEISTEDTVLEPYKTYFRKSAEFILMLDELYSLIEKDKLKSDSMEQLKQRNHELYSDIYQENYDISFANPEYAVKVLGEEYGQILCYIYTQNRSLIRNVYRKQLEPVVLRIELLIEIYNYFENPEELQFKDVKETVYSFEKDNTEIFMDITIQDRIDPGNTFASDIVMNSNLKDLRYLYQYGEHIGANEIGMAEYLISLPEEEIDRLASVYTEGYRIGFVNAGKDLSKKGTVDIRYFIGFERIIRAAIKNFADMGLKPVIYPGGYESTKPNKQYWFDHKFDEALYLDKAYVKRKLEVVRQVYESYKDIAAMMAGPAVIEIFGETPFEPENKEAAYRLSEEQQKLHSEYMTEYQRIVQDYIKGDERSFTIIAFPMKQ